MRTRLLLCLVFLASLHAYGFDPYTAKKLEGSGIQECWTYSQMDTEAHGESFGWEFHLFQLKDSWGGVFRVKSGDVDQKLIEAIEQTGNKIKFKFKYVGTYSPSMDSEFEGTLNGDSIRGKHKEPKWANEIEFRKDPSCYAYDMWKGEIAYLERNTIEFPDNFIGVWVRTQENAPEKLDCQLFTGVLIEKNHVTRFSSPWKKPYYYKPMELVNQKKSIEGTKIKVSHQTRSGHSSENFEIDTRFKNQLIYSQSTTTKFPPYKKIADDRQQFEELQKKPCPQ